MTKDRLTREQRELLRGQVDQARRQAQRPRADRSPTELQQNTAEQIAAFLVSKPGCHFSMAEIGRALDHSLDRVKRALTVLEHQQRATPVQAGRFVRWKAPAKRA